MRNSGLFRYQSSCFSFSMDKWSTGNKFSLLDLSSLGSEMALTPLISTWNANWGVPKAAAPQLCCLCPGTQGPSFPLFLYQKRSSRKAIPWEKQETKVLSCLSGLWPFQGRRYPQKRAKMFDHWLTMTMITRMLVPGKFKYCSKNTNHCKAREE